MFSACRLKTRPPLQPSAILQSLHNALENKASLEDVLALLSANPHAIRERRGGKESYEKGGELPLHWACKYDAPVEVVQALIASYPESAMVKDGISQLPLHYACEHQASLDVVRAIIAAYPEAAREKNAWNQLPLHFACGYKKSLEVVQALIAAYPEAAGERDKRKQLPLHYASTIKAPLEVVQALMAAYPAALKEKDGKGRYLVHAACHGKATLELMQVFFSAYPEAASERDEKGLPLLHSALTNTISVPVFVLALIAAYPEAAREKNAWNQLPLHSALEYKASPEVVLALIAAYPEAAKVKDGMGQLPLNSAINKKASPNVVQALIDAYPEAAGARDNMGQLPLHFACANEAHPEVVQALLSANPYAISEKDNYGRLPLHFACGHRAPMKIVQALIAAYPEAAREMCDGVLPLHLALTSKAPLEVVQVLIAAYPEAVKMRNKESRLPLHAAFQYKAPLAMVQALIAAYPEAIRDKDGIGRLPFQLCTADSALLCCVLADLPCMDAPSRGIAAANAVVERQKHGHTWNWLLDVSNDKKDEVKALVLPVVQSVLSLHPHFAHHLAHSKDEQGREAMSTTSDEIRRCLQLKLYFLGRYELEAGPAAHKSATALVHFAIDRDDDAAAGDVKRVALKFMAKEDQFAREQAVRKDAGLDDRFVERILAAHSAAVDELYESSAARIGPSAYPYCLVMSKADRSLKGVIDSEHIAGREEEMPAMKMLAEQLVRCVQHVHDRGLVHGDLKPLNVMRVGEKIKLIDLDAAASFLSDPPQWAASKSSSAFLPPELLCVDAATGLVGVRRGCVAAHWSQDMWALGCVLYHLFAGEALFLANTEDNLTEEADKQRALGWAAQLAHKEHRLSRISHTAARYLVSQLLSADPARRPSAQTVLAHSFFTGRQVGRMVGQEASFDVFISYRVDSDAALALAMHDRLSARGVRVWLDVKCLADGQDWEVGFCNGLVQSRCLLPILSKSAIKARFEQLHEQSACDNVLLEHRLATELQARGLVERIFPLFVGELDAAGHYGDYFQKGQQCCHPSPASSCCVAAVEAKLRMHLERQALGLPLKAAPSVKDVLGDITISQGGKVMGGGQDLDAILDALAERVAGMVSDLAAAPAAAANAAADVDSLRGQLEQERRRCAALEAVLRAHNVPSPP